MEFVVIEIVFENENFVLCNKPSGVLTTPSRFEAEDSRTCLGRVLETSLGIQIFPVNRLDLEVSGIVVFAKNAEAHRQGNSWFENKQVTKTYRAYSQGQRFDHIPADIPNARKAFELKAGDKYEWKSKLLRGKRRAYEAPHGKPSLTNAEYLGMTDGFHTWDLQPITGRSHQLRFDMSRHGFPILGDKLYGSLVQIEEGYIALNSYKIDFSKAPKAEKLGLPKEIEILKLSPKALKLKK